MSTIGAVIVGTLLSNKGWSRPKCGTPNVGQDIITEWGKTIDPAKPILPEYPRPQMTRADSTYKNLNGLWEYAPSANAPSPKFGVPLPGSILVPFPVESCLSGVGANSQHMSYRTTFDRPFQKDQILLHFGAVDWQTTVYINGKFVGNHTGGYSSFFFDITFAIKDNDNEVIVIVYDPSEFGPQPQGKQRIASIEKPGGDHYTPSSGIWQTVWLENVPSDGYVDWLAIRADLTTLYLSCTIVGGEQPAGFKAEIFDDNVKLGEVDGIGMHEVTFKVPSPKLWSPDSPFLYKLVISTDGDSVTSYFGMRELTMGSYPGSSDRRLLLNGKPIFAAGWLDQSWWPDGQYTAPTDAALESDISAVKTFGLNMVRLHQKINPERWYYAADKLGVMIFQDAVQSEGRGKQEYFFKEDWASAIKGRGNHPSIVQWEIFNEGDCYHSFNVPALFNFTKQLDPYRLIDVHSGGDLNVGGDVNDIHTYPYPGTPKPSASQYGMIGEFGGIGAFIAGKEWVPGKCHTYLKVDNATAEAKKYIEMASTIKNQVKASSASVYTQITDVELECDGFLNYDRSNKFSLDDIAAIKAANAALIASAENVFG